MIFLRPLSPGHNAEGESAGKEIRGTEHLDAPGFCCEPAPWPGQLKVLWIWHAAVVGEYQKPLATLGRCPALDMSLLVPYRWPERAGQMVEAEGPTSDTYRLVKASTLFTGLYYVYSFPDLLSFLLRERPDVIYCYEEPHAFISAQILFIRRLLLPRTRVLLYAAQNIKKRYPPPFTMFERYSFHHADAILACGVRVAQTLRSKGYRGALRVVPLPVDTDAYSPDEDEGTKYRQKLGIPEDALLIGYLGKLVEEKGLRTLWQAFASIATDLPEAHLVLAGGGPLRDEIADEARASSLAERVHIPGIVPGAELPAFMNALDVFVLPSETRRNWREQFGRVLVEAMACGVPVVGSDSGEIPTVLGGAGPTFHEGDAGMLASCLRELITSPALRERMSRLGRERALRLFSTGKVAAQHYAVYKTLSGR